MSVVLLLAQNVFCVHEETVLFSFSDFCKFKSSNAVKKTYMMTVKLIISASPVLQLLSKASVALGLRAFGILQKYMIQLIVEYEVEFNEHRH